MKQFLLHLKGVKMFDVGVFMFCCACVDVTPFVQYEVILPCCVT